MYCKLVACLTIFGVALLLGGCGTQLEEARPVFGYSGLSAGSATLSSYEQGKVDFAAARYGLAAKYFELAIMEDPSSVEAVNGLAATYDQLGRYDLSERYYRRTLAMEPNSAQTLNNFGYSLLLQGRHDLALAFLRDAVRLDPGNAVILTNAERAVAARLVAGEIKTAVAASAGINQPTTASDGTLEEHKARPRIVRLNAGEQLLKLEPDEAATMAPVSMMPAVPVLPVEVHPLPVEIAPKEPRVVPVAVSLRPAATPTTGQNALPVLSGSTEAPLAAGGFSGIIELSNGNGRRHMAARMKGYLEKSGVRIARLTNADHFAHAATVITYRAGHRGLAEALAKLLPLTPTLQEVKDQASDVCIRLGGDLLSFDHALIQAERTRSHASAA